MMYHGSLDRALGALIGGAVGDAMGMPTQSMSALDIREKLGGIDDFRSASDDHPIARGLPAGSVTDDTQQTLLLAQILLQSHPNFDHHAWAEALVDWERNVIAQGGYDLLGPSTKQALEAIKRGVPPQEAGRGGNTNGSAMRIAPVGLAMPLQPIEAMVAKVRETCLATHNTGIAIAGACAVAAAISAGLEGKNITQATQYAINAARLGVKEGAFSAGADIAARIDWAVALIRGKEEHQAAHLIRDLVGTSLAVQETIPAAFAVLTATQGDVWQAARLCANLGGDTDTIGAISCSMAGACCGYHAFKNEKINHLRGLAFDEVERLARDLLTLRFSYKE